MKIAIGISGEYREFDTAFHSWPFNIIGEPDYYFSTWSVTRELNPALNIDLCENVDIDRIKKKLNPHLYAIDSIDEIKLDRPYQYMINRWHRCLNLIIQSGIKYDIIVLIRPDIWIKTEVALLQDFLEKMENDVIYGHISDFDVIKNSWMQDIILCGKFPVMVKLLEIPCSVEHSDKNGIHGILSKYFSQFYSSIKNINGITDHVILRSNSRNLDNHDFEFLRVLSKDWYKKRYNLP